MPKSYASTIVNASADTVWSYVRDFANLHEWLPSIETCKIVGDAEAKVGAVRELTAQGGEAVFHERLTLLDDEARRYTYEFIDSPLPVWEYRSEMRVAPVTDSGQTFIEWWGDFEADEKDDAAMAEFFTKNVYGSGLETLHKRFS
ncbi:MAG TPA: SRPBCC family protein [Streptosporangiaceae bacterium]|jgi:ribosome-associated toxin RatA of RatAB toxin-antitoxin module